MSLIFKLQHMCCDMTSKVTLFTLGNRFSSKLISNLAELEKRNHLFMDLDMALFVV